MRCGWCSHGKTSNNSLERRAFDVVLRRSSGGSKGGSRRQHYPALLESRQGWMPPWCWYLFSAEMRLRRRFSLPLNGPRTPSFTAVLPRARRLRCLRAFRRGMSRSEMQGRPRQFAMLQTTHLRMHADPPGPSRISAQTSCGSPRYRHAATLLAHLSMPRCLSATSAVRFGSALVDPFAAWIASPPSSEERYLV